MNLNKICRKCGIEKLIENFSNNKNTKDGKNNYCRVCKSQIDKKSNKIHYNRIKRNNKLKLHSKNEIKIKFKLDKGGCCKKCGENRLHVLDFHHIDESIKRAEISTLIGHLGSNNPIIKEEIAKCILLCSNCHRDFHYLEKLQNIKIEEYII